MSMASMTAVLVCLDLMFAAVEASASSCFETAWMLNPDGIMTVTWLGVLSSD